MTLASPTPKLPKMPSKKWDKFCRKIGACPRSDGMIPIISLNQALRDHLDQNLLLFSYIVSSTVDQQDLLPQPPPTSHSSCQDFTQEERIHSFHSHSLPPYTPRTRTLSALPTLSRPIPGHSPGGNDSVLERWNSQPTLQPHPSTQESNDPPLMNVLSTIQRSRSSLHRQRTQSMSDTQGDLSHLIPPGFTFHDLYLISEHGPIVWEFKPPKHARHHDTDQFCSVRETGRLVTFARWPRNVQTNLPIPVHLSLQRIYYFEITILTLSFAHCLIGIAPAEYPATQPGPGLHAGGVGFMSNGKVLLSQLSYNETRKQNSRYCPSGFRDGDVVGCAVLPRENILFFTLNGKRLGTLHHDLESSLHYPTVGADGGMCQISANFGEERFRWTYANEKYLGYLSDPLPKYNGTPSHAAVSPATTSASMSSSNSESASQLSSRVSDTNLASVFSNLPPSRMGRPSSFCTPTGMGRSMQLQRSMLAPMDPLFLSGDDSKARRASDCVNLKPPPYPMD